MIVKIIKDNIEKFDKGLLEYSIQLNALNYLKRKGMIEEKNYNKIKCTINRNYTLANKS